MTNQPLQLHGGWLKHLQAEFNQAYMQCLLTFLRQQKERGKTIYPEDNHIFAALNAVDLAQVKVVILGQDPYHGSGQAHGLSFSVPQGVAVPPSLKNIYQEIHNDVGGEIPTHGNLSTWTKQGVLLLNSVLTVEKSLAGSHQGKGWERFTDKVIDIVSSHTQSTVFLLWGAYAQKKGQRIDRDKHLLLKAPHPSPLSAYRGFMGCRHFSQTNSYLRSKRRRPIHWLE